MVGRPRPPRGPNQTASKGGGEGGAKHVCCGCAGRTRKGDEVISHCKLTSVIELLFI